MHGQAEQVSSADSERDCHLVRNVPALREYTVFVSAIGLRMVHELHWNSIHRFKLSGLKELYITFI